VILILKVLKESELEILITFLKGDINQFQLPKSIRSQLVDSEIIHKNGELTSVGEILKRIVTNDKNTYDVSSSGWEPTMG
jgi:hypothetical protein